MKKLTQFFFTAWRPVVATLSLAVLAYVLYFHHIGSLLPGYSSGELRSYANASSWHNIVHNPINAPYKLVVWAAVALGHHSLLTTRLVAASFSIVAVLAFFMIVRSWHGFRVAFLATIAFASSAGFLHIARLGSGQILQMGVLVFMGLILWYRRSKRSRLATYLTLALCFALMYIPGLVWFEIFSLVLLRKGVRRQLAETDLTHKIASVVLGLAILLPLLFASFRMPHLLLTAAGLPTTVHAVTHAPVNLLHTILAIGVRSNGNATLWLGHAPLLNVIELSLAAIGAYYYFYQQRSARAVFLGLSTVVSIVLISLGGVNYASLVPLLYLFVASGIANLLSQWLTVFPRNPIARATGIGLVCLLVFFSVLYQTRAYFVAWPHNVATRQAFDHPQP